MPRSTDESRHDRRTRTRLTPTGESVTSSVVVPRTDVREGRRSLTVCTGVPSTSLGTATCFVWGRIGIVSD